MLHHNINNQLKGLSSDPLMSVFREKRDTQEFMFSRLQEILTECIKETNNDYTKKLMNKMTTLTNEISSLKSSKRTLENQNVDIKNMQDREKRKFDQIIEEKVKEFSKEIETYKNMINLVEGSRLELENEVSNLKK